MTRRTVLLIAALAVTLAAVGTRFAPVFDDARFLRPVDYMEYWSAGRTTLDGQNPYDGAAIYPYQLAIQKHFDEQTVYRDPIMMWNPPWTLPLTLPLAAVHWRVGQLAWFAANLLAVLASAVLLWRLYSCRREQTAVAVGVAVLFAPTLFLLLLGQISGFLLLGVVGFQILASRDREGAVYVTPLPRGRGSWYLAGLLAALTAIKPHLLVPFAVVLVFESLRGRPVWRSVVAGGVALAVFSLIPLLWNPDVWTQYRAASAAQSAGTHNTLSEWTHPTLGYWLRTLHPDRPFALMFVPLAVALPLVVAYWWVRRDRWEWVAEMPRLVLASLVAAPYGAWGFDLVLLLVPVVQAAVWVANDPRRVVRLAFGGAFTAVNLVALMTLRFENSMCNPWLTPAVLLGYVVAAQVTKQGQGESPRAAARGLEMGVSS
jgi:UPF0716 family protein affecting phage T7 exclusion